jgi:hypothetical protein
LKPDIAKVLLTENSFQLDSQITTQNNQVLKKH